MIEIIQTIVIAIISISINTISYYYLQDKHKDDKKIKNEFPLLKSLTMYAFSILAYVLCIGFAYFVNLFALDLTSVTLMVITVVVSYLLAIVFSFVHSNMTVEFLKYLLRNDEKDKRIVTLIIHNILVFGITYASISAFVPLLDYTFTKILRIVMLISFILSFTIVIIYKEIKSNRKTNKTKLK